MGGRWNPQGIPVAYLAESRALAALEIIVHFGRDVVLAPWSVIDVEVPELSCDSISPGRLPAGWNDPVSMGVSRKFGEEWVRRGARVGIMLPSAIIPEERIVMLNVNHPEFEKLVVSKPRRFFFDRRLG